MCQGIAMTRRPSVAQAAVAEEAAMNDKATSGKKSRALTMTIDGNSFNDDEFCTKR